MELFITIWLIMGLTGSFLMNARKPITAMSWPAGAALGPIMLYAAYIDRKDS
jgi:hypothetical protein